MAAPVRALVATAVSRAGEPCAGMVRGRLLEAGTTFPPTRAVAVTKYLPAGVRPVRENWREVLFFLAQAVGACARHAATMYSEAAWLLAGELRRTVAVVGPVGLAAAMVGAPALGVRMDRALAPGTSLPERVTPTTRMVSVGGEKPVLEEGLHKFGAAQGRQQHPQDIAAWPPAQPFAGNSYSLGVLGARL